MNTLHPDPKENAAMMLSLFLAEEMRMHKVSLGEAKEIARGFVTHKNLIDNEEHMLRLTIELSKDFPALKRFEKKLVDYIEVQDQTEGEKKITEFVAGIMDTDPNLAMQILEDAISDNNNLDLIKQKYPQFADYLTKSND